MPQEEKADYVENITELRAKSQTEPVASFLSINLEELEPGYARVSARLKPEWFNFMSAEKCLTWLLKMEKHRE